ncbi:MAG: ribosome small subunit-dependent GTPase A [Spirochaetales bacterium]|nr:ribosome small subunit-dependent GTPase A [Leptospiraceae bacterium]MCP5480329.1 ribosome small subunit-dependent GTPase A [Spirochaetales bacterium]
MTTDEAIVSRVYGAYQELWPWPGLEEVLLGRLRGRLRLEKARSHGDMRHLLIVGDHVEYTRDANNPAEANIEGLLPRRNVLARSSAHEIQALGANLDRSVLIASLARPRLRTGFIDRFLVSAHAGQVSPVLLFTKPDLLEAEEREFMEEDLQCYRDLGYSVFVANLLEPEPDALKPLLALMSEGVTLLAGQSGTGKSTFLNRILGRAVQPTATISPSSKKGRHTTTNAALFRHPSGRALLIDSPGVKEWGIGHLSRDDIIAAMPELGAAAHQCQFADCKHESGSRGCAVQEILVQSPESGGLTDERLRSFEQMLASLSEPDRIRTGDYIKPTGRMRTGRRQAP